MADAHPSSRGLNAQGLIARGLICDQVGPVDLTVKAGECLAVTGPSGAGKSLVLRMLADLIPHGGDVRLGGQSQAGTPAPLWRKKVAYVAAVSTWWAATMAGHFTADSDPSSEMAAMGLASDLLSATPDRLSTGERQRFSLVLAMMGRPQVLLLDEPTSALDPDSVARVEQSLARWMDRGGMIVMTSHDSAQLDRMAGQRVSLLGRVT